jgi:D-xylose transport system substrate-binding protein
MKPVLKTASALCAVALAGGVLAACGSSSKSTSATTVATTTPTTASAGTTAPTPTTAAPAPLTATSFTRDFSAMAGLSSVVSAGSGKVAAILPDTVSSARYTEFDAPYLTQAFAAAGLSTSDTIIQNAQGSDSTQLTDAQSDISSGATVLVVDPLDAGVGTSIESYATAHGVPVVDYDRLVLGGSRKYYVSFDNVKVGTLIGNGMVSCVASWKVAKPTLAVMVGSPTDNNATLFAQGYNAVLKPLVTGGSYSVVANPAGTWDPPTALTEFQQAYTAHASINAALVPNDENAAPIISYLKTLNIPAKKFPVTGQDATLIGIQNVISGYQCGTAYKPIYLEAQAAASLALYLRAGKTPPAGLVNGSVKDTTANVTVPSSLLIPEWVTPTNVQSTVVADGFIPVSQLCTGAYTADCTTYGIH